MQYEQSSVFGPMSTGGVLWSAELLLAGTHPPVPPGPCTNPRVWTDVDRLIDRWRSEEPQVPQQSLLVPEWFAKNVGASSRRVDDGQPTVLELGCGGIPASGMCALALGWSVIFTDLPVVFPSTKKNVALNTAEILRLREQRECELSPTACDVLELDWTAALPERIAALSPFHVVLCSDCIYRLELHAPLAQVLAKLLGLGDHRFDGSGCMIVVAYQHRVPHEEALFFTKALPAAGLQAEDLPFQDVCDAMAWPSGMLTCSDAQGSISSFFAMKMIRAI